MLAYCFTQCIALNEFKDKKTKYFDNKRNIQIK